MEKIEHRLEYIDGLRGLAALWVFAGHTCNLIQFHIPLIGAAGYAVDLFIMISGFLMYYQTVWRQPTEPMDKASSAGFFYLRRFFRLAPAYYVMFAIWFFATPYLLETFMTVHDGTGIQLKNFTDRSAENIMIHISFLFGLVPEYHSKTVLPDWSIGLEMQYYLVFPLLFLVMHKLGHIKTALIAFAIGCAAWMIAPEYMSAFRLPAFLLLKLNVFVAGMLICAALCAQEKWMWHLLFMALALIGIPMATAYGTPSTVMRMGMLGLLALLALKSKLPLPATASDILHRVSAALGRGVFLFMGEISYGVYLIHILVLIPVSAFILNKLAPEASHMVQYVLSFGISAAIIYPLSWLLYKAVEQPGIRLGKLLISRIKESRQRKFYVG